MKRSVTFGVLLAMASACGSTGSLSSASFTRQVGTAPRAEVDARTRTILERHNYIIHRTELDTNLYYETQWRGRRVFEDEQAQGVLQAESRVIVRARPRSREANSYTVNVLLESRGKKSGGDDWVALEVTPELRRYAEQITGDLQRELAQGIRVR